MNLKIWLKGGRPLPGQVSFLRSHFSPSKISQSIQSSLHTSFIKTWSCWPPRKMKSCLTFITISSPSWRHDGRQEWRKVGSQGRRAHPAATWTPVSSGPLSTWDRNLTKMILCWIMIDKIYIGLFLSSSLSCLTSLKISRNSGFPLKFWGFKFFS